MTNVWCDDTLNSERASALNFEDAATPRFGHNDVVFDLFIESRFFTFNHPLIYFFETFLAFYVSLDQNNLTLCEEYPKFGLLSIFVDD